MTASGQNPLVEEAAIIGVGLMGGSLGLDLRAAGVAARVTGVDLSPDTLAAALETGAIDRAAASLEDGLRNADAVFIAAPVTAISGLLARCAAHASHARLITDLGSTKSRICVEGRALLGDRFVGGHPMAGSETGGISSARPGLFRGAAWAITCAADSGLPSADLLVSIILAIGARPIFFDAETHDRLAALVSHLPHVLSFAFARTVAQSPDSDLARSLAGGSYRDLMRVSASDRAAWAEIFRENRNCLLDAICEYRASLDAVVREIEKLG